MSGKESDARVCSKCLTVKLIRVWFRMVNLYCQLNEIGLSGRLASGHAREVTVFFRLTE